VKLLIGYDGSEPSEAAIVDLRRAGLPDDVEAFVVSVADLPLNVPRAEQDPPARTATTTTATATATTELIHSVGRLASAAIAEARETSQQGADLVKRLFPGWRVRSDTLADSPYRALIAAANERRIDLISVGSQGRTALRRIFFGSVSQNVLAYAPCSVRVGRVRVGGGGGNAARILLAFDGSAGSEAAAHAISLRRWPAGSTVRVMTAINPQLAIALAAGPLVMEHDCGNPAIEEIAAHRADAVVRKLVETGLSATQRIVAGDAKRVLIEEAESWGASCVFLGALGHSRLERFLLGSVSASVAARAGCSVEVIRSTTPH
jgi:nucleotide-binding universal stress UspA family protein